MGIPFSIDTDRRRRLGALAVAVALAAAPAAQAEIRLHIAATGGGSASDEVVFEEPVKQASGHMFAGVGDGGGSIEEGLLGCPSTVCGPVAATPGATAAGFADMTVGRVGVAARAWSNPPEIHDAQAFSSIHVNDTLFASGNLTFHIRVDLGLNASHGEDTFAGYDFVLTLVDDPDFPQTLFAFSAWDDPTGENGVPGRGASYEVNRFWEGPGNITGELLSPVPSVFTISIDVPAIALGQSIDFGIYNFAQAESDDSNSASVSSLNSGYVGIEGSYASSEGYDYAGYTVPEPGTTATGLAGGAVLLGLRARRRRTGACWTIGTGASLAAANTARHPSKTIAPFSNAASTRARAISTPPAPSLRFRPCLTEWALSDRTRNAA
jgi:hypothetical protein